MKQTLIMVIPMRSRFYQQSKNGKKTGDGGFTLIELLIVVAIIGILATVSLPIYQYFIGKAKVTVAKNTLHTIQTTLESYNTDRGSYPLTINFSSGLDDIGQIALQPQLLDQIATDLFAVDSYIVVDKNYTLTARANDTSRTTLIVTPTTIATQD